MKKTKKIIILSLAFVCMVSFAKIPASAQGVDSTNFTVQAVIPSNQIDKKQSYFDLKMNPGQSQTLSVKVINISKQEITIDVALRAASTNRNGVIEYQVQTTPDETLKVPFDKIAKTDSMIKVAAHTTKKVNVTVTMPENEYDGTILGGIVFTKRQNGNQSSGVSINNLFSYVIGVKLTETDKQLSPDFRLKSIEPTLVNYRNAVVANIVNPVAMIFKGADVTANIYNKNGTTSLFSVNKTGISMAPNSVFPLPIEWEGQKMNPGDYRLELKLTYNKKLFEWNEDFKIDSTAANEINKNTLSTPIPSGNKSYWWIPVLIVGVIILLWLAFMFGRRRPRRED